MDLLPVATEDSITHKTFSSMTRHGVEEIFQTLMSDSRLRSLGRGGASQPAGGGLRSQIVLRRTISRGMSKPADETSEGVVGYSLLHWTEFSIPSFRRD